MKVTKVGLVIAAALGILTAGLSAGAGQPAKVPRVGVLHFGFFGPSPYLEAFRTGLRELGYVEGRNIALEVRWMEGNPGQQTDPAAELVRLKVDVIVAAGSRAIAAARQATRKIPIVMPAIGDPVGTGLVTNPEHPGGNITGLSILAPEASAKRLEILKEVLPKVSRVALFRDPTMNVGDVKATEAAAQSKGLELQVLQVRGPEDFEGAFQAARQQRAGALLVLSSGLFYAHRLRVAELAAAKRLPAIYDQKEFVEAGGLLAYGASVLDLYGRAASYVDKLLKGAKPGDLPIAKPTRFELVLNLKTAKALGLTIPPSILVRADQVIR